VESTGYTRSHESFERLEGLKRCAVLFISSDAGQSLSFFPKMFRFIPSWLQNNLIHTRIYAYHQTFHLISSSIVSFFVLYNLQSHACIIVTFIFSYSLYLMGCWGSAPIHVALQRRYDTNSFFLPFWHLRTSIHTSYPYIL